MEQFLEQLHVLVQYLQQHLHSNAFLYATKQIQVITMQKGENRFYIAANYSLDTKELYNTLLHKKNTSIKEAIQLTKELKVESLELKKLKNTADEMRQILIQYKKTKTTPPSKRATIVSTNQVHHQTFLILSGILCANNG